eukprot:6206263-Pleurochrysis_carterae.AAC.1
MAAMIFVEERRLAIEACGSCDASGRKHARSRCCHESGGIYLSHEQTVQRQIHVNAKTCKCACMVINLRNPHSQTDPHHPGS